MKVALALAAPLSLMVASCQSEEDVASGKAGKGAAITVEATYPGYGMDSRVTLGEENADIVGYWSAGDKLLITDGQGNNIGTLDLTDGAGTKHATFTGNLAADVANGTHDFRFTYLGAGVDVEGVSQTYTLDISTQDGKFESLIQRWLFTGTAEYTVANGNSYAKETLTFSNLNPTAHFELIFPEGVSMNGETVTISGDNLKSSASVDLASGTLTDLTDGNITVTGTDGDFYINMLPAQDVAPTFTVTVDGAEYQGSLDARNWAADEFVRKGHAVGVPVQMTKVGGDDPEPTVDDVVGPVFTIDGKRYRFTAGNLYYNTQTKVWGIFSKQTDFVNAGGLDLQGQTSQTPELIGLFSWGATGLEDAQQPTTLREYAWQTEYGGTYFPSTAGQSKNSTIKSLWANEYVYDWGRAYMESGRSASDDRQYITPSKAIFTALMQSGFVQGATIKGGASDGSDVVGLIVIPGVSTLAAAKELIRSVEGASCLSSMKAVYHNNAGNTLSYKNITISNYEVIKALNDAVFFPAASKRNLSSGKVYNSDGLGWYWSSDASTTNAYNLYFDGNKGGFFYNGYSQSSMGRFNQMAVRLLVEVKE